MRNESSTQKTTKNNKLYSTVTNTTRKQLTHEEVQLLIKIQNIICTMNKNQTETLGTEAETVVNNTDITEQQYYRHAVAKKS